MLGEITQQYVLLLIDEEERALWALCYNGGQVLQAPTNEPLIVFPLAGSGETRIATVAGHEVRGMSFFPGGELVRAGWDATLRVWSARRSAPIAVVSGSAPFRCVDAAADRIVAGDQKGNVWFLAPMSELYPPG